MFTVQKFYLPNLRNFTSSSKVAFLIHLKRSTWKLGNLCLFVQCWEVKDTVSSKNCGSGCVWCLWWWRVGGGGPPQRGFVSQNINDLVKSQAMILANGKNNHGI